MRVKHTSLAVLAGISLLGSAAAQAQMNTQMMGATAAETPITVTLVFKIQHEDQLARYIQQTVTPGPHYHDYLSVGEFAHRYAPPRGQVKQVARYFADYGIRVDQLFDNNLAMTLSGPAAAFEQAFDVQMHDYQRVGSNEKDPMRDRFHRPDHAPHMPNLLRKNNVLTVIGLSNQYQFSSLHTRRPATVANVDLTAEAGPKGAIATHDPGNYTVGDVAQIYNVNPLYGTGINGQGVTLGIATYADFLPSDAQTYWNSVGLATKPNRIRKVRVDGGGEYGADAGTGETTLDVEQSGGLAPFADIVVYDAPNSDEGGIHMFYQLVSDNTVDTLSYSWGLPEIFYYPELNGGVDNRDTLRAMNQAFMEAAAQGISLYAASGDAGAYDTDRQLPAPDFSKVLSVDSPASSPYVTAAGGTTLPLSLTGSCPNGPTPTYDIVVPAERAWAYDYLSDFYQTCYGMDPVSAGIFSGGDGGGVSVFWDRPSYQMATPGMRASQPGQTLTDYTVSPAEKVISLKAGFAGRNVPDISMNADPYSGYIVYSTVDGGMISGFGGTSFVAPQLNGITALLTQDGGERVGFINPQLYRLQQEYGYGQSASSTDSPSSPLIDIARGDNWFWQAVTGYDAATGLGVPDVARWADALEAAGAQGGHGPSKKHDHG